MLSQRITTFREYFPNLNNY